MELKSIYSTRGHLIQQICNSINHCGRNRLPILDPDLPVGKGLGKALAQGSVKGNLASTGALLKSITREKATVTSNIFMLEITVTPNTCA